MSNYARPRPTALVAALAVVGASLLGVQTAVAVPPPATQPDLRSHPEWVQASLHSTQPMTDTYTIHVSWSYSRWAPGSATWTKLWHSTTPTVNSSWILVTLPYTATSHYLGGVRPDKTYTIKLANCSATGCTGASTPVSVTLPPAQPRNVSVSWPSASTTATARWTDAATTESRYEVGHRRPGEYWPTRQTTTSANATSAVVGGAHPSSPHWFGVRACNHVGCSEWVQKYATSGTP